MPSETPMFAADDQMSELIGRLYTAAAESTEWPGIATTIASALSSTSAVLKIHGPESVVHLLECTENLSVAGNLQSWAAHWHEQDLWVERSAAFGVSRIVTDQDLVTPEEQQKVGFYQEWLSTLDIHHMVGVVFPAGDEMLGVLGVHRPKQAGAYTDDDRRKVAFLLPHLQRAIWISQKFTAATTRQLAVEAVLDRIDAALFVVDRDSRIVTLNARAEYQLHEANSLIARHGRLMLENRSLKAQLDKLIKAAIFTASGCSASVGAAMTIPRADQLPLMLLVTPLYPESLTAFADPLALVMVRDPETVSLAASCLRELFGFTRTEALIAADLAKGFSIDKVATHHGIGIATVRSHVKQILLKTGTHRLAEAVALIAHSVAGLTQS